MAVDPSIKSTPFPAQTQTPGQAEPVGRAPLDAPDAESQELFKRLSQDPKPGTGRLGQGQAQAPSGGLEDRVPRALDPKDGPMSPRGQADGRMPPPGSRPMDASGPRDLKPGGPGPAPNPPHDPDGFGTMGKPHGETENQEAPESLSSLISAALGGHREQAQAAPGVTGPSAPVDTSEAQELAEKLVSRVLVADSTSQGQSVRLTVDPALLPGTEIHLNRGLDGFLNVTLLSNDPNSLQTLIQARGELEQALNRSEGAAFRLTVEEDRGDRDAQGDSSQRRSAGLDFVDPQD